MSKKDSPSPNWISSHRSELLSPAGSLEKLKVAIHYGADAVYMGTPDLSLRTKAQMSLEEVVEGVKWVHQRGKRAYLTLNLFSHNKDVEKLPTYVETIRQVAPDGLIVADPGFLCLCVSMRQNLPCIFRPKRMFVLGNRFNFGPRGGGVMCF